MMYVVAPVAVPKNRQGHSARLRDVELHVVERRALVHSYAGAVAAADRHRHLDLGFGLVCGGHEVVPDGLAFLLSTDASCQDHAFDAEVGYIASATRLGLHLRPQVALLDSGRESDAL